jgi:hypothetical protein
MRVLAIDPGLYSTAVFYSPGSSFQSGLRWIIADIPLMQEYRRPDPRILRDLIMRFVPDRAFVELVGPMPRQGLASTSTFMRSTGYIEATVLCTAAVEKISPDQPGIIEGRFTVACTQISARACTAACPEERSWPGGKCFARALCRALYAANPAMTR